jgi:hypothetical protein
MRMSVLWLVSSTHHILVNITADSTTAIISCTWRCSFNMVQMKKCAPRMVESTDKQITDKQMSESSVAFSGPCHTGEQACRNHWQLLVLRFEFSFHQAGAMPSLVARVKHNNPIHINIINSQLTKARKLEIFAAGSQSPSRQMQDQLHSGRR